MHPNLRPGVRRTPSAPDSGGRPRCTGGGSGAAGDFGCTRGGRPRRRWPQPVVDSCQRRARPGRFHGGHDADQGRDRHRRHLHRRRRAGRPRPAGSSRPRRRARPRDPAEGFLTGVRKVLDSSGVEPARGRAASCHGTTVATNQLLRGGRRARSGFVTTEGYEFVLEIARQSVPDGYGNSYFWVKPPRLVPADLVRTVGGPARRRRQRGPPVRRGRPPARWPGGSATRGVDTIGVCFLHSYAEPRARAGDARGARRGAPGRRRVDSAARCCPSTASTSAP